MKVLLSNVFLVILSAANVSRKYKNVNNPCQFEFAPRSNFKIRDVGRMQSHAVDA